jgi:hypothetical protein
VQTLYSKRESAVDITLQEGRCPGAFCLVDFNHCLKASSGRSNFERVPQTRSSRVILDRIMVVLTMETRSEVGFASDVRCESGSDLRLEISACRVAGLGTWVRDEMGWCERR